MYVAIAADQISNYPVMEGTARQTYERLLRSLPGGAAAAAQSKKIGGIPSCSVCIHVLVLQRQQQTISDVTAVRFTAEVGGHTV